MQIKKIERIPSGAVSIVRVGYECEECGREHQQELVLHKDDEDLMGPIWTKEEGFEVQLVDTMDEAIEKLVMVKDDIDEDEKIDKGQVRMKKGMQLQMELSQKTVVRLIGRLEKRMKRGNFSFIPKLKCECGHVQNWMKKSVQKRGKRMLQCAVGMAVLGFVLFQADAPIGDWAASLYWVLGGFLLVAFIFLWDGAKMILDPKVKARPRVDFGEIQYKIPSL